MKLNSLQPLRELKELTPLSQVQSLQKFTIDKSFVNEIDFCLYSANIGLYTMRILRDEITVRNREAKLSMLMQEMGRLNNLLSKRESHSDTQSDLKAFYKRVGLKPKHTEI